MPEDPPEQPDDPAKPDEDASGEEAKGDSVSDLRELALRDGRYSPEALTFLFHSLQHAIQLAGKEEAEGTERHVSGQELLEGMRHYAIEIFGPLAAPVWRSWGVNETIDWGHIVFLLVDNGMLNRQESDTIEDFRNGFDYDEAFVDAYRPQLPDDASGADARDGETPS